MTPGGASFSFERRLQPAFVLLSLLLPTLAHAQTITSTSPLPSGTVNVFYSTTLSCTNCTNAIWGGSGFPPGLSIDSSTGTISGDPTTPGTYTFPVTLQLIGNTPVTKTFSLTINPAPLIITSTSFPNGTIGLQYPTQTLTATGGVPPYSWGVSSGLPPGLGISNNGSTWSIVGTPTTVGTFAFILSVVDSHTTTANIQLSITIGGTGPAAAIDTTSLPNGALGVAYTAQLICSNCVGYTWSVSSGTLPTGLQVNAQSGIISGTPTATGTYSFQVSLTPSPTLGSLPTLTQILSITINAGGLSINQSSLPVASQNTPYSTTLTATGGTTPYTWSFTSTSNDGLTIGATTGTISGSPTATGQFALTVQVADSNGLTASKIFILTVSNALSILTTSLPSGTLNVAYPTQTLTAGGGQPPYRWVVVTTGPGNLPPGLTLDGVFGRISGTPTNAGVFPFTLMVTDNNNNTASGTLSITIGGTIVITPATLPNAAVNTAYSQTLTATGGQSPYGWAVTSGSLPVGLTLGATSGVISGTPTLPGSATFTVTVTDYTRVTAQASYTLIVSSPVSITTMSLPDATVGTAYSQTVAATGGTTPYTWAVTAGALPAGLTLNATTGVISGTPTTVATSSFTVTVTDAGGVTAKQALSIATGAALTVTPTTLPAATVGVAYTQKFTAAGGKSPYTFAISGTPAGFTFAASTATISGTATTAGSFPFTVTVTDSAGTTINDNLTLTVNSPSPPTVTVTFTGPSSSGFEQQIPVSISIGAGYPVAIAGSVTLTFAPSVTPSAGVEDAMIQFSSGSRTINFTIPAGSTTPTLPNGVSSITVLTGTTAGTITLTTSLTANGQPLGTPATKTIVNNSGVPFISSVTFQQTPGGITVTVVGFSSTRDMVSGLFNFAPATNVTFASSATTCPSPIPSTNACITVPLATAFSTWWTNTTQANPYGTQFTLTAPFSLSTQSTAVVSVTVTLTNSKGASNPVTLSQ